MASDGTHSKRAGGVTVDYEGLGRWVIKGPNPRYSAVVHVDGAGYAVILRGPTVMQMVTFRLPKFGTTWEKPAVDMAVTWVRQWGRQEPLR